MFAHATKSCFAIVLQITTYTGTINIRLCYLGYFGLILGYPKLLQPDERKCPKPNQCDNQSLCPVMRLKQHLSQGVQKVLHFRYPCDRS